MSDKNKDNKTNTDLPDISGIFDIDEKKIPDKIIKKDPETDKKIDNPILTSDEARKTLPKKDRKVLKKEDRSRNRIRFNKKMKKNLIIALAAAVGIIIAVVFIFGLGKKDDTPEVFVSTPVIEPVSSYYTIGANKAFTVNDHLGKLVAFFENNYDNYNLTTGLSATVTTAKGKTVNGKIVRIDDHAPTDAIVTNYYELIEGKKTSRNICAVYIKLDNQEDTSKYLKTDGELAQAVVITTETVENALTVPLTALITEDGGDDNKFNDQYFVLVYSEEDATVKRVPVTTGIQEGDKIQITSGLESTAKVVTACVDELDDIDDFEDGSKVKVKE